MNKALLKSRVNQLFNTAVNGINQGSFSSIYASDS